MKHLLPLLCLCALLCATALRAQDPHAGHNHPPGEGHDHPAVDTTSTGSGPSVSADSIPRAPFPPPAFDYEALDRLVVQHGGRRKPFLTFALEMSREITGRAKLKTDTGIDLEARAFATSLLLGQPEWAAEPLVLVDYAPLKKELGLDVLKKRFSFDELAGNPALPALMQQIRMQKAREGMNARLSTLLKQAELLGSRLDTFNALLNGSAFTIVPPAGNKPGAAWVAIPDIGKHYKPEQLGTFNNAVFDIVMAYHRGTDAQAFATAAARFVEAQHALAPDALPSEGKLTAEIHYDTAHPFRWAWICYFLAAVAFAATWRNARKAGGTIGWSLTALGLVLHLAGFITRIYISGRAPVTNMYETIVWVALGLLAFAIWFEAKYRSRVFILSALPLAVAFMIAADSLPVALSPSLNPLVAVLRDNFWLTTHVLTVTTSYAAFALAMAVGHVALFKQILKPGPQSVHPDILAYIYRTMQVGIILIVFGIILGGVWANYSWGRFWGWDPKETAALIAALVYLAILHGRIAGWWTPFGFAVGAVLGFQSVILAWYGVNFILGAGLHSYGFGTGGQSWVVAFCILEVVLVAAAVIRRRQGARV